MTTILIPFSPSPIRGERKMTNSPPHFWLAHSRWFGIKHSHVRRETGRGENLFDPGKEWVRQKKVLSSEKIVGG